MFFPSFDQRKPKESHEKTMKEIEKPNYEPV
jgi:hypothetical protein